MQYDAWFPDAFHAFLLRPYRYAACGRATYDRSSLALISLLLYNTVWKAK